MSVRIKADEVVGYVSPVGMKAVLKRTADLDRGLYEVREREVANVQLQVGFGANIHTIEFHPRHLQAIRDLLEDVQRRIDDLPSSADMKRAEEEMKDALSP